MIITEGLVIRSTGNLYQVLCDDGVERTCKAKGKLRLRGLRSTSPIVVGDRVEVELRADGGHPSTQEEAFYLREILPRRNYIVRRATNLSKQSHILAANIDVSYLVCTLVHPETSTTFIDRFLANAEAYRVPTELVFNKVDILTDEGREALQAVIDIYEGIGYPCHSISALERVGLERLQQEMQGRITLLSGHSGVGKSTLINSLIPEADLRTGKLSEVHNAGMHTTTFSQMIPLEYGGYLIDTPGIKGFGLLDMGRGEVSHYFREIFELAGECRFANCTHTHEPSCAVREALQEGGLAPSRYASYLSILEEQELEDKDKKYRGDN